MRYTYDDMEKFYRGECDNAYAFMGAHPLKGKEGFVFRVWAPLARSVHLVGDFNFWNISELSMKKNMHGLWEIESTYAKIGDRYQYYIERQDGTFVYKSDPYAFSFSTLPDTTSRIASLDGFSWSDLAYRRRKKQKNVLESPVNIYEVHLGSWKRKPDGSFYQYDEIAEELVSYVKEMGYTHIELMPLTEHPFEGSWGYQVTGYFAPTHRYGTPHQLMEMINTFHRAGIGVILDWVPAHFPKDESGLYEFDGTCCYEKNDPVMNEHKEWGTRIFDYGRYEVISFLISSALFWIRKYHIDGIRVDAVASMLYLDYCRTEFKRNCFGGNYHLEAIEFFKKLNRTAFAADPSLLMIAEESTAFPMVTKPGEDGGLGFNFKWNMGWMNDILRYMKLDPIYRKSQHNLLTFSLTYAFSENYILPLSHDEVVHGKYSLLEKMPGSYEDKFASLRLLFGYMFAHPGKKLNFMGGEFGQFIEWNYQKPLDWMLLDYQAHRQMKQYVKELNRFYAKHPAFWDNETGWQGFSWISSDDRDNSVIAFRRIAKDGSEIIAILNFCPVYRDHYRIGLPEPGVYEPVFSSDRKRFGGKAYRLYKARSEDIPMHGYPCSGTFCVPPLSATYYQKQKKN